MARKKKSLRARVAEKLAQANRTNTAADIKRREVRLVPDLARSPRAGFTPQLLANRKASLRRVDNLRVHPSLNNIDVQRTGGQDVGSYMDLVADSRQSTHRLMSQPGGTQMMTELNTRIGQNRANIGANADVMIRSTRPNDESNMNAPHISAGLEQGYRFDGAAGTGWGSEVRYDPNQPSANRFIGLGHEMVHAHRLAHGKAVGVPQLNQNDAQLFTNPVALGADVQNSQSAAFGSHVRDVVKHVNHLQEEFETVGLSNTPGGGFNPTENMLRAEHGKPLRGDYSRAVPGETDAMVSLLDNRFDNRSLWDKLWNKPAPKPVSDMIRRYHR